MNEWTIPDTPVLKHLYYEMLKIRRAEEKLAELFNAGYIKAPIHLSIGQEAVAVGIMSALEPNDKIVSNHRCHAHYIAKGGDLKKMFAEICGKSTGCCQGKGGTMHLFDDEAGIAVSSPLVGASIALAVGIALSSKIKEGNNIAVAFFGDGAVEEGIFWESLNFSSVHKLPMLFVCENNLYATHAPILKRQPCDEITPRVEPHGIVVYKINGNHVVKVREIAKRAVEMARRGNPCFIEARTYRLREHWGAGEDWHLGYRAKEEGEWWIKNRCPFKYLKQIFSERNIPESEIEEMEIAVKKEIDEAATFAIQSPAPLFEDLMDGEV